MPGSASLPLCLSSLCAFVPLCLCASLRAFVPLFVPLCLCALCAFVPFFPLFRKGGGCGVRRAGVGSRSSGSGLVVWENQFLRGMIDDCNPERFFQTSKPDPSRGNGVLSEQTEDAQFGAEALVVVVLGVGGAFFVDEDQLGAESEEGERRG